MFIDTHTHITWGIDDGIPTLEDCKAALRMAKEDGIERIIATPHFIPGKQGVGDIQKIVDRMIEVQKLARMYGIKYYPGSELFLNRYFMDMLDQKLCFSLANSRYLLVEFNVRQNIQGESKVEDRLYECMIRGFVPVIAHVERYFHEGIDLERVRRWIQMGCKIQVNRTSIIGQQGKIIQKNALALLDAGLAHIVATDTHRINGSRISKLSDVYTMIAKRYGEENAQLLTYYNPMSIIENKGLENMVEVKRKIHFFFRKD